jgi:hypothetical protein
MGYFQNPISDRAFPVVDVSDDRKIADSLLSIYQFLFSVIHI